jgi:hypothetical protein
MEQRRASTRSRTLLEGQIIFDKRLSRVECTVRDISETGARIIFANPARVPPEFELRIPKRKLARQARVVWYDGQTYGVMFVEPQEGGIAPNSSEITAPGTTAADVRKVVDEARLRIAQLAGLPIDRVRLKLDIDY